MWCGCSPRCSGVKHNVSVVLNSFKAAICRSNHASALGRNESAQLNPVRKCLTPSFRSHVTAASSR